MHIHYTILLSFSALNWQTLTLWAYNPSYKRTELSIKEALDNYTSAKKKILYHLRITRQRPVVTYFAPYPVFKQFPSLWLPPPPLDVISPASVIVVSSGTFSGGKNTFFRALPNYHSPPGGFGIKMIIRKGFPSYPPRFIFCCYRTRVRSLAMLVSNSHTDSLTL